MKSIKDICFVIQARLNSTRIPRKMIKSFSDTTLMDLGIQKILNSTVIPKENFYCSVYEQELVDLCKKYDVNIFNRSEQSRNSECELVTEIYEWWDKLPFKYVVLISACNPLLKIETIDNFIRNYLLSNKDGLFGVVEKKTYYWDNSKHPITDWKGLETMNTKLVDPVYEAAHCLYASRMDIIGDGYWMDTKSPPEPELFIIEGLESFDIDYEWQFEFGQMLYKFNGIK